MRKFIPIILVLFVLALAGFAQGPVPSFPSNPSLTPDLATFQPVFQKDVFVLNPYVPDPSNLLQAKSQVNPVYALSETSALELSSILRDYHPVIFHSGPFGWFTSGQFSVNKPVPWFLFPDGAVVNAGLLAQYFSHGYPAGFVGAMVQADLAGMHKYLLDNPGCFDYVIKAP